MVCLKLFLTNPWRFRNKLLILQSIYCQNVRKGKKNMLN